MSKEVSPVGSAVSDRIKESLKNPALRAEYERLAPYEALARIVIMRRGSLGLTQAELAVRMGTTASAISRIESGQHATSARTLKKLGDASGPAPCLASSSDRLSILNASSSSFRRPAAKRFVGPIFGPFSASRA